MLWMWKLFATLVGVAFLLVGSVSAQDHSTGPPRFDHNGIGSHPPKGEDPYVGMRNLFDQDCCHGKDCRSFVGQSRWVNADSHPLEVWLDGKWCPVTRDKLVKSSSISSELAKDGSAHICLAEAEAQSLCARVRCVWPGPDG